MPSLSSKTSHKESIVEPKEATEVADHLTSEMSAVKQSDVKEADAKDAVVKGPAVNAPNPAVEKKLLAKKKLESKINKALVALEAMSRERDADKRQLETIDAVHEQKKADAERVFIDKRNKLQEKVKKTEEKSREIGEEVDKVKVDATSSAADQAAQADKKRKLVSKKQTSERDVQCLQSKLATLESKHQKDQMQLDLKHKKAHDSKSQAERKRVSKEMKLQRTVDDHRLKADVIDKQVEGLRTPSVKDVSKASSQGASKASGK
ncbi:MAG: hypothetical protein KVP17_004173 [Porospora cf. gigantea B]|uniref:uncharacterized protein n=1 Tax=Porospora cf. gigantea B TaxID=2853592 RepID=UPI003571F090|nr:MAG: hypothetical protein KVP17_004173 [Porospora cf. gigantea B]